jgi:phosphonate transport system permease protein
VKRPEDELIHWAEARGERRKSGLVAAGLFALLLIGSGHAAQIRLDNLAGGLPEVFRYLGSVGPDLDSNGVGAGLQDWFWGWRRWLSSLLDTLAIAFLATLMGSLLAAPLSFAAAKNLGAGRVLRLPARRVLQFARTVPDLVFALVFVIAFGLGPLAGVLALGVHSAGSLGKLFTGINENLDTGPVDSVRAAGANWPQAMRFAVLPQALPSFVSYALLRLEINVRSAAVVGFVGVGGIGQELYTAVRQFVYRDVGAILLLIVAAVVVIDYVGDHLRERIRAGEDLHAAAPV